MPDSKNWDLEVKKLPRYFASVDIQGFIQSYEYGEGNITTEGIATVRKSFGTKMAATKWIAKMKALDEVLFFRMSMEEKKAWKDETDIQDFCKRVNMIAKELFGKPIYKIYDNSFEGY